MRISGVVELESSVATLNIGERGVGTHEKAIHGENVGVEKVPHVAERNKVAAYELHLCTLPETCSVKQGARECLVEMNGVRCQVALSVKGHLKVLGHELLLARIKLCEKSAQVGA